MTKMKRLSQAFTVLFLALTAAPAFAAGVLGYSGPLVPDENGNWKEFRTNEEEALLSVAPEDTSCSRRLPENLRQLFFEHFRYYADHTKEKIGEDQIARFAKVLGMAPHESGGASAAVTDMKLNGSRASLKNFYTTDNPGRAAPQALFSSTHSLDSLLALKTVTWNKQTNFGLLQMSADRLTFGGGSGELASSMIADMKELYRYHPEEVIARCGTKLMFKDEDAEIRDAFNSIQACKPGYSTKDEVQCFGRWATLCPNYNVTLALIAPSAYFATRKAAPLCAKTFRNLLKTGRADGGKPPLVAKPIYPPAPPPVMLRRMGDPGGRNRFTPFSPQMGLDVKLFP